MDSEEGNLIVLQKKNSVDSTGLLKSKLQHLKVSVFTVVQSAISFIALIRGNWFHYSTLQSQLHVAGGI